LATQGPDQAELGRVHILELVHRQMPVAPVHPFGESGIVEHQVGRPGQDVVEVEGAATVEGGLVGHERRHHLFGLHRR
jgi:hypothetical protein